MLKKILFSLFILSIITIKPTKAATFNLYAIEDAKWDSVGNNYGYFYNTEDLTVRDDTNTIDSIVLLKFNTSNNAEFLATMNNGEKIVSATLNLYKEYTGLTGGKWSNEFNYLNNPENVYFSTNTSWQEGKYGHQYARYIQKPSYLYDINNPIGAVTQSIYSPNMGWEYANLDISSLNEVSTYEGMFSLIIDRIVINPINPNTHGSISTSDLYISKDNHYPVWAGYGPYLTIETSPPSPVPEPSSVILGIMGISSFLLSRKKQTKI